MRQEAVYRTIPAVLLLRNLFRAEVPYTAASGEKLVDGDKKFVYPFQWFWDTGIFAGWMSNVKQAIIDLRELFKGQMPNGFMGHIRYTPAREAIGDYFPGPVPLYMRELPAEGNEIVSRITQPPTIAYGILELSKKLPSGDRRQLLEEFFPACLKYHEYLYNNLVQKGRMISTHPWAVADDNSPKYDVVFDALLRNPEVKAGINEWKQEKGTPETESVTEEDMRLFLSDWLIQSGVPYERVDIKLIHPDQRPTDFHYHHYLMLMYLYGKWGWDEKTILEKSPFRIADPMSNAILLRSNLALKEMAEMTNQPAEVVEKIDVWIEETKAGLESLWDEQDEMYYARDLSTGELIRIRTISSFLPLFSRTIPSDRADLLIDHLEQLSKKHPHYMLIPSTFPDEKTFDRERYWRGPVWPVLNIVLAESLLYYKENSKAYDLAAKIIRDTVYLLRGDRVQGGYHEYYSPLKNGYLSKGLGSPRQSWTLAAEERITQLVNEYPDLTPHLRRYGIIISDQQSTSLNRRRRKPSVGHNGFSFDGRFRRNKTGRTSIRN